MTKMLLFPSIGRLEPMNPNIRAFTEIRVRHEMEMVFPQQSDDYFRVRDNIKAEAEIVAKLPSLNDEDKGALMETTVHRFSIEVPPVLMNLFDTPMYNAFGSKLKTKFNTRARTIQRFLAAQESQTRFDERMHDEGPAPGYGHGSSTTLSLPHVGHPGLNPIPRRNEISPLDTQNYEIAMGRFQTFFEKKNRTAEEEILPVRKFFTMLREQHGANSEIEKVIAGIEKSIATEMSRAIQFVGG